MASWRSGLTRWSAKPLYISSNLILASKTITIESKYGSFDGG